MHIALFGATGGTGRNFAAQALDAGHTVTALVRVPSRLRRPDGVAFAAEGTARLRLIEGNVLDPGAVAETVASADAVFVTLGTTGNNPPDIVSSGTAVVIDAMKVAGVRRLVVISSLGVADSRDQVPWWFRLAMTTVLKPRFVDKAVQEQTVRESGLEWTILRPGGLTNGPPTGRTDVGTQASVMARLVSRADVAAVALRVLATPGTARRVLAVT